MERKCLDGVLVSLRKTYLGWLSAQNASLTDHLYSLFLFVIGDFESEIRFSGNLCAVRASILYEMKRF